MLYEVITEAVAFMRRLNTEVHARGAVTMAEESTSWPMVSRPTWIGGLSAVHQFVRIGHQAMVGGASGVEFDVIPFGSVLGNRAHLSGLNISYNFV